MKTGRNECFDESSCPVYDAKKISHNYVDLRSTLSLSQTGCNVGLSQEERTHSLPIRRVLYQAGPDGHPGVSMGQYR